MTTFFVNNSQINGKKAYIMDEDFHHVKNVLRCKIGEKIAICDEDSNKYIAKIDGFSDNRVELEIINKCEESSEAKVNITLYQGIPKQDKMELIIQKVTELGVNQVVPVAMEHSVAKLDTKNEAKKIERWQKIAKEAATQCGRQAIPKILSSINFQNIIENIEKYDIVILLYENESGYSLKQCLNDAKQSNESIKNIALIIGPEGGFSKAEIDYLIDNPKVKVVTLGKRILRTETASIASVSMLMYELDM